MGTPSEVFSIADEFERKHVHPKPGRTLVVGSKIYGGRPDRRQLFSDALGVDMLPGDGVDTVLNLERANPAGRIGMFDHIECCSVLEHSRRPWKLAANLESLLNPRGTLYVSVPFIWRVHAYPNDYFRFTAEGLRSIFNYIRWKQVMYGFGQELSPKPLSRHYASSDEDGERVFIRTEVFAFGVRG